MVSIEGITAEDSEEYLVPEIEDSDWELEYAEVDSDDHPYRMAFGWLVESYSFRNDEKNVSLTCNVEAYNEQPRGKTYSIFVYVDDEQGRYCYLLPSDLKTFLWHPYDLSDEDTDTW